MPLQNIINYNAANTVDAMDRFAACVSAAGWEIWDSGLANNGYVFKSKGSDNSEWPCYIHMYKGTNTITCLMYAGWDNVTHTGSYYAGNTGANIDTDDDGSFYIFAAANEDSFMIDSYITEHDSFQIFRWTPYYQTAIGRLAASVTAGSSKTITLSAGDANNFTEREYRIFNADHRELTNVTSVIPSANQIVVDSLTYNYVKGDRIAIHPHCWGMIYGESTNTAYMFEQDTNGTGNNTGAVGLYDPFGSGAADPDTVSGLYPMWPYQIYNNSSTGLAGIAVNGCVIMKCDLNVVTHQHTVSVDDLDSGTVTSAVTSASITDNTKSWTTNEYQNKVCIITAGPGAGQYATITSNTSDTLNLTYNNYSVTPDGTSNYIICSEGWMWLAFNSNASYGGVFRVV